MGITATPDPGLNGNIDIYSPLPTNNTIRYIDLEVTNEDGVTRTVTIAQYPLEYITNILGWYSYRDDFGGTTYELLAGQDVDGKTFDSDTRIRNWICGCTWSQNQWSYGKAETGFFGSKVAGTVATSGTNAGKAHIYYYQWKETEKRENIGSVWRPNYVYRYTYNVSNSSDVWSAYANPRMYHVRITASSGEYTLGVPRITDGKTDPGTDNAELVSPSFMIASQLGAVQPVSNVDIAASHCEQYVEVYKDKNGQTVHLARLAASDPRRVGDHHEIPERLRSHGRSIGRSKLLVCKWIGNKPKSLANLFSGYPLHPRCLYQPNGRLTPSESKPKGP